MTVFVLMLDGGFDGDSLLGVYATEAEANEAGDQWFADRRGSIVAENLGYYTHAVEVGAAAKDYLSERMSSR